MLSLHGQIEGPRPVLAEKVPHVGLGLGELDLEEVDAEDEGEAADASHGVRPPQGFEGREPEDPAQPVLEGHAGGVHGAVGGREAGGVRGDVQAADEAGSVLDGAGAPGSFDIGETILLFHIFFHEKMKRNFAEDIFVSKIVSQIVTIFSHFESF